MTGVSDARGRLRADLVIEYPFTRTTGPVVGAFMTGLRDGRIVGSRRADGLVFVPAAEVDPETGDAITEIVEVGSTGVIETWTWVDPVSYTHLALPTTPYV